MTCPSWRPLFLESLSVVYRSTVPQRPTPTTLRARILEESVIRLVTWPLSVRHRASSWLASNLDAVFDHQSLPHKMPRHSYLYSHILSVHPTRVKSAM